jgi:hypothetical protein
MDGLLSTQYSKEKWFSVSVWIAVQSFPVVKVKDYCYWPLTMKSDLDCSAFQCCFQFHCYLSELAFGVHLIQVYYNRSWEVVEAEFRVKDSDFPVWKVSSRSARVQN